MLKAYEMPPKDFISEVEVSACYLEVDGKILLLKLGPSKEQVGKWGVPAGKKEPHETKEHAAKRELFEETGIDLPQQSFKHLKTLYMQKPSLSYTYHLFQVLTHAMPSIVLSDEHTESIWASREALKTLPLMLGAEPALAAYTGSVSNVRSVLALAP